MTSVYSVSHDPKDIEDLLTLNPKVQPYANAVPSIVTKKAKKHWKRNADKEEKLKNCGYILFSIQSIFFKFSFIVSLQYQFLFCVELAAHCIRTLMISNIQL